MRRFAEAEVLPHAHEWHLKNEYIPAEVLAKLGELGVFAPHPAGGVRRPGPRQGGHVRRLRGAVARLHRRRLARHALGDRRRADPGRRHRGAEAEVSAEDRLGRAAADRRVHRAQHRLRPRLAQDARRARGRRLQGHGAEDLDHASRARRPDDAAGAHQSHREGLQGPLHAAGREAARQRRRSVPGQGHVRRRDRGAGLSRHEGVRHLLRRLRGAGGAAAGRRRGPGLQAADDDLRGRPHPDGGARHRRGPVGHGPGAEIRARPQAVRQGRSMPSRASPTRSS